MLIDIEGAYSRVSSEVLCECLEKKEVSMTYIRAIGFLGPKSKNPHGGTVLDDTDMSGQRSRTSKMGRKRHGLAVPSGTVVPCSILARFSLAARVCFGAQYTWRPGFSSRGKTLDF